jgi:hypothetical protein
MASFPLRITADAFEALTAEAQAEILHVLEPHASRGGGGGAAGGAERPRTPPAAIYPPAWSREAPGAPARPSRDAAAAAGGASEDPVTPPGAGGPPAPLARVSSLPAVDLNDDAQSPLPAGGEATPPGYSGPRAPMWRTGSCGEAGPFIGLGYGWTCELARRMARWPDVDPFHLKQQMFAEPMEEPDLLRDFTEQEVVDGMAHYSWDEDRTRAFLVELRTGVPRWQAAAAGARISGVAALQRVLAAAEAEHAAAAAAAAPAAAPEPWHRDPAAIASQWR